MKPVRTISMLLLAALVDAALFLPARAALERFGFMLPGKHSLGANP
jgi:hypothetical protein